MDADEYGVLALQTRPEQWTPLQILVNGQMGINGEGGEVAEVVKKHVFQGHDLDTYKLKRELGDVLWYINSLANGQGWTLSDVMQTNLEKLAERYPEKRFSVDRSVNRQEHDV